MLGRRRTVITGLGCVTPLGINVERSWSKLLDGASGISYLGHLNCFEKSRSKVGGFIPVNTVAPDGSVFTPDEFLTKDTRRIGVFAHFAICAANSAIADSGIDVTTIDKSRVAVSIGSGIGGLDEIEKTSIGLHETGRLSPFFIISALANLAGSAISIMHGFSGPLSSPCTACATGNYSISDGLSFIRQNQADIVIAGSCEHPLCGIGVAGFDTMRALSSKFNQTPTEASRPWDKNRDGFVISEGAGILILEEYEHAKKRNAKIYAEVLGCGLSSDAHHLSAPHPSGNGAILSMQRALADASVSCSDIDYISAHGTSTPLGDISEAMAIKAVFGDHSYKVPISSIKSALGHSLGAAGSIEAVFATLSIRDNAIPPTLNLFEPDEECDLDFVPLTGRQHKTNIVLSNSFGFGGVNASLVLSKI